MRREWFLIVTAVGEAGTGIALLVVPSVFLALLLGADPPTPGAGLAGRVTGAALFALGVACWRARNDRGSVGNGLLTGVLIYDGIAAVLLAFAGLFLGRNGPLLWPAVAAHAALAVWGALCRWGNDAA